MKAIWSLIAIVVLGSTMALAQTTNQQNSPAPNGAAGSSAATAPSSDNAAATESRSPDTPREGRNFGWIGLLGLAGLAGLRPRSNERHESVSRRATA
jgi:MYXO-CTERM domain-containing protein